MKYLVYLDSNILRSELWIKDGLQESLEKLLSVEKVTISLYIPEVVKQEWVRNYLDFALSYQEKIKTASSELSKMRIDLRDSGPISNTEIEIAGEQFLSSMGLNIVPTPYQEIDFRVLIARAVGRKAPFLHKTHDKGIKDAVIVQTILFHTKNAAKDDKIIVISADNDFQSYVKEIIPTADPYGSLDDFEGSLKLELERLSQQLTISAESLFKKKLYVGEGISQKIRDDFFQNFPDMDALRARIDIIPTHNKSVYYPLPIFTEGTELDAGKQDFEIAGTTFAGVKAKRLMWETTIVFRQEILLTDPGNNTLSGLPIQSPHSLSYTNDYKVTWSTTRSVIRPTIISVRPGKEYKTFNLFGGMNMPAFQRLVNAPTQPFPTISIKNGPADDRGLSNDINYMDPRTYSLNDIKGAPSNTENSFPRYTPPPTDPQEP